MPTVLRQLSLIVAALAGVVTLFAGRTAGVRPAQLGLRSGAAFLVFFAAMNLLSHGVVSLMPDVWSGVRRPPKARPQPANQVGQRLDVTLPGASPNEGGFVPMDGAQLAASGANAKTASQVAQQLAADPSAMARILASMSQGDQEG